MSAAAWLTIAIIFFTLAGALFIAAAIMFFVMNIPGIIGDLTGRTLAKGIENIRNENANANIRSAKAANRRSNPNKQFSIGSEYAKERGNTFTSLAHASRRLDVKTERGQRSESTGGTAQKFSTPPTPAATDVYTAETSVLNQANNQYTVETSVLNQANNQYTAETSVLNQANDQYTNATTVLGNQDNQYTNATTVLGNQNDQYTNATTVLGNDYNEYTQGTTVLSDTQNGAGVSQNVGYQQQVSELPLGFRVVRKVSVTHCNESL